MNGLRQSALAIWWLAQHDLRRESRAWRVAPSMLLLGALLVMLMSAQIELPAAWKADVAAGLYWLAVFFAGTLALERSFAGERDSEGGQALQVYPLAPWTIYVAKLLVNFVAIFGLQIVVAGALVVFADVPLLKRPGLLLMVAVLANLGYAAVGTVAAALTARITRRGGLLALVLLPLVTPVVLAATDATRALVADEPSGNWLRGTQLLAAFAVLFTTLGALLFDGLTEE